MGVFHTHENNGEILTPLTPSFDHWISHSLGLVREYGVPSTSTQNYPGYLRCAVQNHRVTFVNVLLQSLVPSKRRSSFLCKTPDFSGVPRVQKWFVHTLRPRKSRDKEIL